MMQYSKMTIQPEHGDMTGYRLVQEGEKILPDDEYFDNKKWNTLNGYTPHKMSDLYVAHRRKLPEKKTYLFNIETDYIKLGKVFRDVNSLFHDECTLSDEQLGKILYLQLRSSNNAQ
jgi:hypothetical protein